MFYYSIYVRMVSLTFRTAAVLEADLAEDFAHVRPALSAVSQPAAISTSAVDSFTLRSVDPQSIAPLNIRTSAPT